MTSRFLIDGPPDANRTLLLAHGAGAGMDSGFMQDCAAGLAKRGIRVLRFEFPYMQRRRQDGKRRPPDRMPLLREAYAEAAEAARRAMPESALLVGGKSMGGRVASMVADELAVDGLICLGYPFHPAGKPAKLRTEHLEAIRTPTLIVQGTRDPLGSRDEVEALRLSSAIRILWIEDGNHDLAPRRASDRTARESIESALDAIRAFGCDSIGSGPSNA